MKKHTKLLNHKHEQAAKATGIATEDMAHEYYCSSNGFQAFMTPLQAAEMSQRDDVAQVIKDEIVIMMDRDSSGASQKSESLIHMNTAPQPTKSQHTTGLWNNRKLVTAALDKIADENPNKNPPGCDDNGSTPKLAADFLQLAAPGGPWTRGLNGEDIVVGVIDDGIWPEHPSFADDGSYSVLPGFSDIPCVFGNTTHNSKDII